VKTKQPLSLLIIFLVIFPCFSSSLISGPKKLIYLDAAVLPAGKLTSWRNLGTLGGSFVPVFRGLPSVENLKEQKAVNLSGNDVLLRSTFSPPSILNGKRPFTVLAKVYVPELAQRRTILTWSQEPEKSAVFSLGKGRDAAFYNSEKIKTGYTSGFPEAGKWHLLAFIYDKQRIRIYVDGWFNAEASGALEIKPDKVFYLGGQTASGLPLPLDPFNGYLASLEILDTAFNPLEVWNRSGHQEAIPVYPAQGEILEALNVSIRWERGDERAVSFAVYFSNNREEVERSQKKAFKGSFAGDTRTYNVLKLEPDNSYFWRVDQLNSEGKVLQPGIVRSFQVDDGSARNPVPHHLHGSASRDLKRLVWTHGPWASSQDIYFTPDRKKMEKGKPVLRELRPGMDFFFIPEKSLKYGQTYYWQVVTKNNQAAESPGQVWSFRIQDPPEDEDLTFFIASDLHYGGTVNARKINKMMVKAMNSLPGQPFPQEFGVKGRVHTPRGVVILGDIVDDGAASDVVKIWQEYAEDYGLRGDKLLAFPVFEGFGENDGPSTGLVRTNLKNRNRLRSGLKSISADGLHYSWDWGKVHFVQLNIYPGTLGEEYLNIWRRRFAGDARYPKHSLEFLVEDLRRNVGSSSRPVVIFQHYGFDSWGETWWTQKERNAFLQAIEPYNVVAIFWGHSHVAQGFSWNGIKTWCSGTTNNDPEPGVFLVVKIKTGRRSGQMIVATRGIDGWVSAEKVSFPMKKVQKK
jgi:hypothetical protein